MPTQGNANARVNNAIAFALAQVGKPYVWATAGPNSYDCSGLIWKAYEIGAGYRFTGRPTTYTLVGMGREVPRDQIKPGDLIFPEPGHVQMSLGGNAIVEAASPALGIRRSTITRVWHVRRLIENDLTVGRTVSGIDPKAAPPTGHSGTGAQSDSAFTALNTVLQSLSDSHKWIRLLFIVLGILCILIGIGRMAGTDAIDVIGTVTNG